MKYDICMWAKNGEQYLPKVLNRIDQVIPHENVGLKIFVDDSSRDRSVEIAKDHNWNIYLNKKGWINGGTEEALHHVKTSHFISVEQDVYLAKNFMSLADHLNGDNVAVSCGVYLPTTKYGRIYSEHHMQDLRKRNIHFMGIGSNFFNTKYVKHSGFVKDKLAIHDFYDAIKQLGYKWITDYTVVSDHIRTSFKEDLQRLDRFYSITTSETFLDKKNLRATLRMVRKCLSTKYIKTGNPLIPVLEAIVRFKLLQLYLTKRRPLHA